MYKRFDQDVFVANIQIILEQFSYPMHLIKTDESMSCTCIDPTTKAANMFCTKCLGAGYRIRIKNIEGANRSNKISFRTYGVSETGTTNIFYFNNKYDIKKSDMIVDSAGMYVVERFNPETAANNEVVYYRAEANRVKSYEKERLANFYKILGG